MKALRKGRRAVVFLAALGVMVVAGLLVFAMAGSTQFTYHLSGRSIVEAQEQLLVQSALDYAMVRRAAGRMGPNDQPLRLRVYKDRLRKSLFDANVYMMEPGADHDIYKAPALKHRPGDVLAQVESPQLARRYNRSDRVLLFNTEGRRVRPVDVTASWKGGLKSGLQTLD